MKGLVFDLLVSLLGAVGASTFVGYLVFLVHEPSSVPIWLAVFGTTMGFFLSELRNSVYIPENSPSRITK